MRNREPVLRKLEHIESNLNKLGLYLNRGDRDSCFEISEDIREQIEQIKTYIETERIEGGELNP